MEGILPDGASINRPPGFNGEHYPFWKSKFKVYVLASEYGLWRVFEKGNYVPTKNEGGVAKSKTEDEFNEVDMKHVTLNSKAVLMLQSALSQKEYFRICNLATAKEMWEALEIAYEGTSGIKENRINTLTTEYDLLQMKSGETIAEFQFRYTHLTNQLAALGKTYEQGPQVRKILNVLNKDWEAKVTAIEESRGESMASVASLFGSLSEYESKWKLKKSLSEANTSKSKGIALNSINEKENKNEDDEEDEEIAMFVRRFKKLYKRDQGFKNKFQRGNSSNKYDKTQVVCYECEKPGHFKSECPDLKDKKKNFNRFKKKAYVSAIWGDSSSDDEENEEKEEIATICLVAEEEEQQEEEKEVFISEPTYDELFAEYNLIQNKFEKLADKYFTLKKKNAILEQQVENLSFPEKLICDECITLEKKNEYLTKTLKNSPKEVIC